MKKAMIKRTVPKQNWLRYIHTNKGTIRLYITWTMRNKDPTQNGRHYYVISGLNTTIRYSDQNYANKFFNYITLEGKWWSEAGKLIARDIKQI